MNENETEVIYKINYADKKNKYYTEKNKRKKNARVQEITKHINLNQINSTGKASFTKEECKLADHEKQP